MRKFNIKTIFRYLDALMRAQVKVEFGRMGDACIHRSTGRDVAGLARLLLLVRAEETRMMTLLDHNECDAWLVIRLQLDTSLADGRQFVLQDSAELALADAIAVHDDPVGLKPRRLVEENQQFSNHGAEFLNNFLTMLLNTDGRGISRWVGVHGADDGSNGRLLVVAGRRMGNVGSQEDDRLVEHFGTNGRNQDAVDSSQFDVDLEAEVREGLWRCLVDILSLDTLGSHAQHGIANALYFSCHAK